jgi:hypothetical protein
MLLVSINTNDIYFFLPAAIITHDQWEIYADGQRPEELHKLVQKILETFSIESHVNLVKIPTPEKITEPVKPVLDSTHKPLNKESRRARLFPEFSPNKDQNKSDVGKVVETTPKMEP